MIKHIKILLLVYISTYLISFMSILHNTLITVEFFQFLIINFIIYFLLSFVYENKDFIFILLFSIVSSILHISSYYLSHLWGYTETIINYRHATLRTENETVILINILTIICFVILYLIYLLIKKYILKRKVSFKDYFITIGILIGVFIMNFIIFFIINIFLVFWSIKQYGL